MASIGNKGRILAALGIVVCLALAGFALRGGNGGTAAARETKEKALPLVSLVEVKVADLPIEFAAQGHLVSLDQVDVRPQVNSTIRQVAFHEGDEVKAGQLLFVLDAAETAAQVSHSTAQAAQVQAQLEDAQRDYARSKELVKSGFLSPSTVATSQSKVAALQAQLKAAGADIEGARVQSDRTRIVAPISGRTGALAVHPGSLAQTSGSAPLVTIMKLDPIGVEFNLPERSLAPILAARDAGTIKAALLSEDGQNVTGELSFVNNTVSTDSATINLKARFSNASHRLWPGQFANVVISAGTSRGAVVLPPQAILEGPAGRFAYVLDAAKKVHVKPVTLLRVQNGLAVVQGLAAGEQVVLDGAQNVSDGALVTVDARAGAKPL
jgi:RND family efflux transporter MFP subunit